MASALANNWKELLALKAINYNSDSFKAILMQPGFSFDKDNHEEYADISAQECPTLYGYTIGGQVLAGVSVVNDPVLDRTRISWNNPAWSVSGGNLQAAGMIIIDDTIASPDVDPIAGYVDFGATKTTYAGGTFTVANVAINHA